ncbi:MAG: hypothetical protein JW737_03015 [Acidobacteria bacterium]|nr:hypothetical protein [Acidobacteriota bacterium]
MNETFKRIGFGIITLFLFAGLIFSDYNIVERQKSYENRNGKRVLLGSADYHQWYGDLKAVYIVDDIRFYFDFKSKTVTILNMKKKHYVVTNLPMNIAKIFTARGYVTFMEQRLKAKVTPTNEKKTIFGKVCRSYRLEWAPTDKSPSNSFKGTIWLTEDINFDWKLQAAMLNDLRSLRGRSKEFQDELSKLKGFEMGLEGIMYNDGKEYYTTNEIILMQEKQPPADMYKIPEGFVKRETLDVSDNPFYNEFRGNTG